LLRYHYCHLTRQRQAELERTPSTFSKLSSSRLQS
jgi:hypothetical protein